MTQTDRARTLRKDPTEAKKKLWKHLRNRQLEGHKFYRQFPIEPYFVDFLCRDKKLVIEVDGGQHDTQADYDLKRTDYLQSSGYIVIRFWNNEVLGGMEGVLFEISKTLNSLTPTLSLKGEGEAIKSRYKPETAEIFTPLNEPCADWLQEIRSAGFDAFKNQGLPTPRLERWKYTKLLPAVKGFGAELGKAVISYDAPDNLVQDILTDTPDWLAALLSQPPASEGSYNDMALWHLSNACLRDGIVIDVPAGMVVDKPVEIVVTGNDGAFFAPRIVIRLGEGAELTIIEHHTGKGRYWNNALTQIAVGANARLRHYRIQENSKDAVYTQNTHIEIERDGTYEAFTLTAGAALSRNQIHVELLGSNAFCDISGVNILRGLQHSDSTIEVEHKVKHCNSNQFIRSVLSDQAHGVFQGKVHVHRGADKTDANQTSNALLLSEGAEMDTKPELEIYAEDVKCAHGATTGKLEDEALFYMRSRGLSEDQARALLIEAFIGAVVDKLSDEAVKDIVREKVQKWLIK